MQALHRLLLFLHRLGSRYLYSGDFGLDMGVRVTVLVCDGSLRVHFEVARTVGLHSHTHQNNIDLCVDPWSSKGEVTLL